MFARPLACALIVTAALAPRAMAQTSQYLSRNAIPAGAYPSAPAIPLGRGKIALQSGPQQDRAYRQMPKIEQAVERELGGANIELTDLRTGRYQKAMVVCGVARDTDAKDAASGRRFIARPGVATLETPDNSQAFQAGWKRTGCGL
ncbi:hypothetical protein [Caulobacter sp. 1776]|uniref:hypothetical protein n=1 Tax=Caulobacter sp. 1776 TaxID=3156420 RepID=UPI003391F8E3